MTTAPRERAGADASAPGPSAVGRSAKTKIAEIVVVCSKCAKRQGLRPREVRDRLKRAAKRASGAGKIRVVASGCLGPCPKRALAVATGASVAAGRVLLLDSAAGPAAMAAAVLPGRRAPEFGPNADLAAKPREGSSPPSERRMQDRLPRRAIPAPRP